MGNRRKLTEVEEFYVQHNPENLTIDEMAIKMSCNKTILVDMLNAAKPVDVKPEVVVEAPKPVQTTARPEPTRFMKSIAKKSVGNRKGIAVSTQASSEIADDIRPHLTAGKGKYHSAIHNPYGADYDGS